MAKLRTIVERTFFKMLIERLIDYIGESNENNAFQDLLIKRLFV
ncbi:hypothetical protein [Pallidibacillus pasinlerensis]|nr:hypothetical protein [Pallidibacillus pasinlerensis]